MLQLCSRGSHGRGNLSGSYSSLSRAGKTKRRTKYTFGREVISDTSGPWSKLIKSQVNFKTMFLKLLD